MEKMYATSYVAHVSKGIKNVENVSESVFLGNIFKSLKQILKLL